MSGPVTTIGMTILIVVAMMLLEAWKWHRVSAAVMFGFAIFESSLVLTSFLDGHIWTGVIVAAWALWLARVGWAEWRKRLPRKWRLPVEYQRSGGGEQ